MDRVMKTLGAVVIIMIVAFLQSAVASLPTEADAYSGQDYKCGEGLTGHFIDDTPGVDIVTTCTAFPNPNCAGGWAWFRDQYGHFTHSNWTVAEGHSCQFGPMIPNEPWHLAIAGNDVNLYSVDQANNDLDLDQSFSPYGQYAAWGYVNGDEYGDLVTVNSYEYGVSVFLVNPESEELEYATTFTPNGNYYGKKLALVRTDAYWGDPHEWDLVVNFGTFLGIYPNNGTGSFTTTGMTTITPGGTILDFTIGDIDRNGYDDIVICTSNTNPTEYRVKTYLQSNGVFSTTPHQNQSFNNQVTQVALGHYNSRNWDLAVYFGTGSYYPAIYSNTNGNFNFTSAAWTGTIDYNGSSFDCSEMLFADLAGTGVHSLILTGIADNVYGDYHELHVFYNPTGPYVHPVEHTMVTVDENHHPVIKCAKDEAVDMAGYTIYRALMDDDTTKPGVEDFDSLTTVTDPTAGYTDTEVTVHSGEDNYYIWYAMTASDDEDNESELVETVKGWGYYEGSGGKMTELINLSNPTNVNIFTSPNPFNPTTTIAFNLPEATPVTLNVYDTNGRQVAQLVNGLQPAGQHQVTFDGSALPSGLYFYRLTSGQNTATGKMVLLK